MRWPAGLQKECFPRARQLVFAGFEFFPVIGTEIICFLYFKKKSFVSQGNAMGWQDAMSSTSVILAQIATDKKLPFLVLGAGRSTKLTIEK